MIILRNRLLPHRICCRGVSPAVCINSFWTCRYYRFFNICNSQQTAFWLLVRKRSLDDKSPKGTIHRKTVYRKSNSSTRQVKEKQLMDAYNSLMVLVYNIQTFKNRLDTFLLLLFSNILPYTWLRVDMCFFHSFATINTFLFKVSTS
jgi:hypothetical protein